MRDCMRYCCDRGEIWKATLTSVGLLLIPFSMALACALPVEVEDRRRDVLPLWTIPQQAEGDFCERIDPLRLAARR